MATAQKAQWIVQQLCDARNVTHFQRNMMVLTSITMTTGASILTGRGLARNGALSLDSNQITPPVGACADRAVAAQPAAPVPGGWSFTEIWISPT